MKSTKQLKLTPANKLTKEAIRLLTMKGFQVWRQNNGGVFDPVKKVFRANSSTRGISDVIGFNKRTACFIACEIKVGKDILSSEQQQFLTDVERAGGIAVVVRDSNDLKKLNELIK
jgi:hypothetical protein